MLHEVVFVVDFDVVQKSIQNLEDVLVITRDGWSVLRLDVV